MQARNRYLVFLLTLTAGCVSPAQSYNQRGVALFNSGQVDVALVEFQQAATEDPLNADAFYNLGSSYHRLGRAEDADWNYTHCLALDPEHSKCQHARVVLLLERDRVEDAYASVRQWMTDCPGNPDPIVELAWLEKQAGRTEQARSLLQNAIAIQPRHPRALTELASLYEGANQPDRALALYQRALAYDPTQPQLTTKVADLRGSVTARLAERAPSQSVIATNPAAPQMGRDLRYNFRQ
jgi:Tfp pilus assembly protein PilF